MHKLRKQSPHSLDKLVNCYLLPLGVLRGQVTREGRAPVKRQTAVCEEAGSW